MKKIIIHADDFGLTLGVNEGIVKGILSGTISATSCLVNFPTSAEALSLAKQHSIDIGWHINLTLGRPISDPANVPSLVQADGTFHNLNHFIIRSFWGKIKKEHVEKELLAQYQKFEEAGMAITHADGHQHVHVFPVVRDVVKQMALQKKISHIRLPSEEGGPSVGRWMTRTFLNILTINLDFGRSPIPFYGFSLGTQSGQLEAWEKLLARIETDISEVMVHPAVKYPTDDYSGDDFPGDREEELNLLTSDAFRDLLKRSGFQVVGFA